MVAKIYVVFTVFHY